MFDDPTVGIAGAQKVPLHMPSYMVRLLSHLRLRLEHLLSLEIPRLGELVAFRKVLDAIPLDVAVEEAFMEALVVRHGLALRYAPDARVYSIDPTNIAAFMAQRRQTYVGYLDLKHKYGYTVSSLQRKPVIKVVLNELWGSLRLLWVLCLLAVLEDWSRLLGGYDFAVSRNRHVVWDMAWTQKQDVQRARQTHAEAAPKKKSPV